MLDKHKAKTFLSGRKALINESDDDAEPPEINKINNDDTEQVNFTENEAIGGKEKLNVRKDLFGTKNLQLQERVDQGIILVFFTSLFLWFEVNLTHFLDTYWKHKLTFLTYFEALY